MKVKIRPNEQKDNPLFIALNNSSAPDELAVELGDSFMGDIPTEDMNKLLLEDGVEVDGIKGSIEKDISFIAESVPESFPNSKIADFEIITSDKEVINPETEEISLVPVFKKVTKLDENNNPVMRQKFWDEYTTYRVSLDSTKVLLTIGARDSKGNRKSEVKHAEFIEWYKYFGRDAILLNDKLKALIQLDYVNTEEQE